MGFLTFIYSGGFLVCFGRVFWFGGISVGFCKYWMDFQADELGGFLRVISVGRFR
jgi:hypothetical protein